MTDLVIMIGRMTHTVTDILARWPSRSAIHEDARQADPGIDLIAVHRWYQRGAVPAKYWAALVQGAARRGVGVTPEELMNAHAASPSCTIEGAS